MFTHQVYYKAMESRDKRFDGKFFVGVKTTGIYCRPICPAPCPKPENVQFYKTASAAREDGFRPCLRCHPESAPNSYDWEGSPAFLSQALRLISDGMLNHAKVEDLAELLGISPRHLRRLFKENLGTSPLAVDQTRRLHFAKKLIDETTLSFTKIAHSAGFPSIRAFNNLIKQVFDQTPTELRRKTRSPQNGACLSLRLSYRPPFDWRNLLEFLRLRAIPGVEVVTDRSYQRTVEIEGASGWIEVEDDPERAALILHISSNLSPYLEDVVSRTRQLFDLEADPMAINRALSTYPQLKGSIQERPGLRVPGGWDQFEIAVRAVVGQQISVKGAATLLGKLAAELGKPIPDAEPGQPALLFPTPNQFLKKDLTGLNLTTSRIKTIKSIAADLEANGPWRNRFPDLDQAIAALTAFKGIGAWTANYIGMRALEFPDAFPAGDLWLRRAFSTDSSQLISENTLLKIAEPWRPWRAYAAMHIWANLSQENS